MSLNLLKERIPTYAKDVKLNLSTLLAGTEPVNLSALQIAAVALASAYTTKQKTVIQCLEAYAKEQGLSSEGIDVVRSVTAIMSMNNVYYRSVHFVQDPTYAGLPTKLRMHVLQNHGIVQQDFELYCLAVSAINGCGRCVEAHVNTLAKGGTGKDEIHYTFRIAAVIQSVAQVLFIEEAGK